MAILKTGSTFPEIARDQGDFEQWIAAKLPEGLQPRVVDVTRGDFFLDRSALAGCIITGSHDMVTEVLPRLEALTRWIRDAIAEGLPALGICFGHQLLASLYGGEAGYNPRGPEYGTTTITTTDDARTDPLFSRLPARFAAHVCHAQSALRPPPGARVLAHSALDDYQAFRLGASVWGVQFHPEFSEHAAAAYCRLRRDALRAAGRDPDALARGCVFAPHAARLIGLFADFALSRA